MARRFSLVQVLPEQVSLCAVIWLAMSQDLLRVLRVAPMFGVSSQLLSATGQITARLLLKTQKYMQNLVSDCIRNSKRFIGNVNNAIYDQLGTDAAELFRQSAGKPMSHGCGKTQTLLTSCSKQ